VPNPGLRATKHSPFRVLLEKARSEQPSLSEQERSDSVRDGRVDTALRSLQVRAPKVYAALRVAKRILARPEPADRRIVDEFHRLWYEAPRSWRRNTWLGYRIKQLPLDMWLYQELIYHEKPAFVLQTGVRYGGSLLYFAHILDLMGADPEVVVIGVDIEITPEARSLNHARIRLIEGSSTDAETIKKIEDIIPAPVGFVSLDSDHSCGHVLRELETYGRFVGVGGHLVVEDTNINGHPVYPGFGPGPFEAVSEFLKNNSDFVRDDDLWGRNLFSFHQYGWLLRVK
jgi:cephalosporin hydroxylase